MKCRLCEREIDEYPCPYCDAPAPPFRKAVWSRPAFWYAVFLFAVGLGVIAPLVHRYYWRRAKERSIKIALATRKPDRLAEGLVSEYELTGADTVEESRCAKAILESQPAGMGQHLRPLIEKRSRLRPLVYEILGVVGDPGDAAYLTGLFDSAPQERESCVRAVVTITATRPQLLERGSDTAAFLSRVLADPAHQKTALQTMATYPQPDFVPFIQELVASKQLHFHEEAVAVLLDIGTPHAAAVRDAIYRVGDLHQRFCAAMAAARKDPEMAVEWLAWILADPALTVTQRTQAEAALSKLEKRMGLSAFMKEYECDNDNVRIRAVMEAGELRCPDRVSFLSDALRDSSADVHMAAIMALGKRYHPQAAGILIRILEDMPQSIPEGFRGPEDLFGQAVMESIGDSGAHEAVPSLVKFLAEDGPLAKHARKALVKITLKIETGEPQAFTAWHEENKDKGRAEYLIEKLSDDSPKIRDCAYRMLINLTGEKIIFNAYAPQEDRARMISDWKNCLSKNRPPDPEDGQ